MSHRCSNPKVNQDTPHSGETWFNIEQRCFLLPRTVLSTGHLLPYKLCAQSCVRTAPADSDSFTNLLTMDQFSCRDRLKYDSTNWNMLASQAYSLTSKRVVEEAWLVQKCATLSRRMQFEGVTPKPTTPGPSAPIATQSKPHPAFFAAGVIYVCFLRALVGIALPVFTWPQTGGLSWFGGESFKPWTTN